MQRKLRRRKGIIKGPEENQRINFKGLFAIIIGFICINFAFYLYLSVEQTEQVFGVAVMLNDTTSEYGARQRIVVKLENGKTIQPILPNTMVFKKGASVKLLKTKTKLFGAEKYRFAGYQ